MMVRLFIYIFFLIYISCKNNDTDSLREDTDIPAVMYNSNLGKNISKNSGNLKHDLKKNEDLENNEELYKEKNNKNIKFSTKFPIYRILFPGFNFEGICKNKSCEAYNNFCWSPLRKCYSKKSILNKEKKINTINIYPVNFKVKFNLGEEMRNAKCPLCNHYIEDIRACGISKALVIFSTNNKKDTIKLKKIDCDKNANQFMYQKLIHSGKKMLEYEKTTVSVDIKV